MKTPIPQETLASIKESLFLGQKIDAIKLYRECTKAELADANAAVEQLEAELRAASPERLSTLVRRPGNASLPTRRFGWASLAGGTVFALIGLGMGVSSLSLSFGSARTEGTVIKLDERRLRHDPDPSWHPVVEYQVDGSKYSYTGAGSSPPLYTVGQKVRVLYKVDQPEVARIDSFFDRWLFPLAFGGAGAVFAGLGAFVIWKSRLGTA